MLAGLATCDPDFPMREWDRLIEQAELTLNLLRNARANPTLSSWAYLFGNHDFNKSPLAPPGTKVILHAKPDQRKSWAYHGEQGYYIGPAPQHYRCIKVFIPKTHRERITDTAAFIPRQIPIPDASLDSHLRRTGNDLVHLLNKRYDLRTPGPSNSTKSAIIKIAELLQRDSTPDIAPILQPTTTNSKSEKNDRE